MTGSGPDQGAQEQQGATPVDHPIQHHRPVALDQGRARVAALLTTRAQRAEDARYTAEQMARHTPPLKEVTDQIAFLTVIKSPETSAQEKNVAIEYFISANGGLVKSIINIPLLPEFAIG